MSEEQKPSEFVDIVFDKPPCPEGSKFIEVESPPGTSIRFGQWLLREDGLAVLRFRYPVGSAPEVTDEIVAAATKAVRENLGKSYVAVASRVINAIWPLLTTGGPRVRRDDDPGAHQELLEIHRITAHVAGVTELTGDETLTVSRVKQMAMMINEQPSAGVVPEGWLSMVDRVVPDLSPEPDQEQYPTEWALWADRQRIRRELLIAAPTAPVVPEDQVVAWVSPLRYGSQVTFQKPEPPEWWSDFADGWYCRPLIYADTAPAVRGGGVRPCGVCSGSGSDISPFLNGPCIGCGGTGEVHTNQPDSEQGGDDEWIPVEELTLDDADYSGNIWGLDCDGGVCLLVTHQVIEGWHPQIEYFQRTGLTRPQPPKSKEDES